MADFAPAYRQSSDVQTLHGADGWTIIGVPRLAGGGVGPMIRIPPFGATTTCSECKTEGVSMNPCTLCQELHVVHEANVARRKVAEVDVRVTAIARQERWEVWGPRIGIGAAIFLAVLVVSAAILSVVVDVMRSI